MSTSAGFTVSASLVKQLKKFYKDTITIMSQPDCPSVICSSTISVGFRSNQLLTLKDKLKEDELDSESEDSDETSNTATVNFNFHAAKQL